MCQSPLTLWGSKNACKFQYRYTMYYDHIQPSFCLFSSLGSQHALCSTSCHFFLFNCIQLVLPIHERVSGHPLVYNQPTSGHTPKENDSPSFSTHQLPITLQLEVGPHKLLLSQDGIFNWLTLV